MYLYLSKFIEQQQQQKKKFKNYRNLEYISECLSWEVVFLSLENLHKYLYKKYKIYESSPKSESIGFVVVFGVCFSHYISIYCWNICIIDRFNAHAVLCFVISLR